MHLRRALASLAALVAMAAPQVARGAPGGSARVVGARPALGKPPTAAVVLARYRAALAALERPKAMAFEFSLSQLGLHDMEQSHRVYRSGTNERDETLVVDGYRLKAPSVRIVTGHGSHYDLLAIAPRPQTYRFVPVAALDIGGAYRYLFRVSPLGPRSFAVREIELDGHTYLPAIVRFQTASSGARATGELRYGSADGYWVIRSANVVAKLRNGKSARERIVWSRYTFPANLPPDTFRAPRVRATKTPLPVSPITLPK